MRWYTLTWWSGGLTSDSLEGFWAVGNDPDPSIPNLPLENRNQFTCNPTVSTAAVASLSTGKVFNRAYDALAAVVASIVRSTGKQIPKSLTREPLFVGSGTVTGVTGSTTTFNFSSLLDEAGGTPTVLENDIVIVNNNVGAIVNLAQAVLMPSGYTAAHPDIYANDSSDCNHQVSYKFMGAVPDTSVVIPDPNSGSSNLAAIIHVFRYVDMVTPLDVDPTTATASNWGIPDPPALTPLVPGHVIMAFGGASSTLMNGSLGNPSGMSGTTNHFRAAANLQALRTLNATALYYGNKGTYDPAVFAGGIASTNGSWSAITLALRPAGPYTQASIDYDLSKAPMATTAPVAQMAMLSARAFLVNAVAAASLATNRGYQRAFSALAATANTLVNQTAKSLLAATSALSGMSMIRNFTAAISALATTAQDFVAEFEAGGIEYEQGADATTAPVASLARQMGVAYAATANAASSIARAATSAIQATSDAAASLARAAATSIQATAAATQSLARETGKSVFGSAAATTSTVRQAGKSLLAQSAMTAAMTKAVQTGKVLTAATESIASLATGLSISATILADAATSALLSASIVYGKAINAAAATSARLSRSVARAVQSATAVTATLVKQAAKSFAWTAAGTASLVSHRIYALAIAKSVSVVAGLARIFTAAGTETLRRIRIAGEAARIIYAGAERRLIAITAILRNPAIGPEDRTIRMATEEPRRIAISAEPQRSIRVTPEDRRSELEPDQ